MDNSTDFLSGFIKDIQKPDILDCLANLSNDEVFTPPDLANKVLDLLPQELFSNPNTKFLDPVCKSGVFLREIAKRLLVGLKDKIADDQARRNHIFTKQLFGIAITELTALMSRRTVYCSANAISKFSVCTEFSDENGNISYSNGNHNFKNGTCTYCGASEKEYGLKQREGRENHAYEFIHLTPQKEQQYKDMKFDVIIGNPPYQLSDGGNSASATPIYQLFVEQAKKLQPRYLTMIIPARWYSGGKGLDEFRANMIADKRVRVLHDFLNADDCFAGVEIKGGVCYFLWDKDNEGDCEVTSHYKDKISKMNRPLAEKNSDVFIRQNEAIPILNKVLSKGENTFDTLVSSRKPFAFATNYTGRAKSAVDSIELYERGKITYINESDIERNIEWVNKHKIFMSKAYNAGDNYPHQILNKPIIANKNTACTETYIVIGTFDNEQIAKNVASYIETKFFRFLVFLRKISQDATSKVYQFVPIQDFSKSYTDAELYKKYNLSQDEIAFIESMIKPMGEAVENG